MISPDTNSKFMDAVLNATKKKNSMAKSAMLFLYLTYLSQFSTQLLASYQLLTRTTPLGIGS
jgi:hypothetical protein